MRRKGKNVGEGGGKVESEEGSEVSGQVTSGKLARNLAGESEANDAEEGLKYTREDAKFMCSHTWLVLTREIVS